MRIPAPFVRQPRVGSVTRPRARYATLVRMLAVLFCVLAFLMGYVVLTSSRTGLSYAVARAAAQREALQEETMRLDDRIAGWLPTTGFPSWPRAWACGRRSDLPSYARMSLG